jgi:FkbM family methyltransferase
MMNINRDLVIAAYRLLLEREPETEEVIQQALATCRNTEELRSMFLGSAEYATRNANPITYHSTGTPQQLSIIEEYFNLSPDAMEGFVVNRLGVRTRVSSLWDEAQQLVGTVIPAPVLGDFHGSPAEWIGLLKSVRSATKKFVAMELGAGWGPWLVAGAVAARNNGIKDAFLLAVEADPGHFISLRQHFIDNGLNPEQHRLIHAAVGSQHGWARWPFVESRSDWGSRPIPIETVGSPGSDMTISDYLGRRFSKYVDIEVMSIVDLLTEQPRWDFLHMDVQGDEAEICQSGLELLSERVHWLVVGTHSRTIEGRVLSMFMANGWVLESEIPVSFVFRPGAPTQEAMTERDGTQVWCNPRLD